MKPFVRALPLVLVLVAPTLQGASCGAPPPRSNLNYGDRARAEYEQAMQQLQANDVLGAADAFRHIRREYGLSRWAWLAELRLADVDFKQEKWAEAIQGYRTWIRYHPTQPEVAYARFMIARCYFSQIPNDWALVPSSWERDQSSTHDAADAFDRFLQDFPESEYTAQARDYQRRTRELLARHEITVAEFYLARNHPEAAVSRFQGVLDDYSGSGLEPEALLKMGETYLLMGRRAEAHAAFESLVQHYSRSSFVDAARRYLRFIGNVPPPAAPTSSSSPAPSSRPQP